MKTKFSNKEIVHVWASQTQQRGKSNSMFFEGPTIYSYGYHFPMARIYSDESLTLLTSKGYSTTTAKHMSQVRGAINTPFVVVPDVTDLDYSKHSHNLDHLVTLIKDLQRKAINATKNGPLYAQQANLALNKLGIYLAAFKIPVDVSKEAKKFYSHATKHGLFTKDEQERFKARLVASQAAEELKRQRIMALKSEHFIRWQNGEDVPHDFYEFPVALRLKGEDVETSRGAKVPIDDARKFLCEYRAGRPLDGFRIGFYTCSHIADGNLVIGCHMVPLTEIERLEKLLEKGV